MDFPQETKDFINRAIEQNLAIGAQNNPLEVIAGYGRGLRKQYDFKQMLYLGEYAPFEHERERLNIRGYNCTTMVPTMYLLCDYFGKDPQIAEFCNFQDHRDKSQPTDNTPHFSIFFTLDEKRYMFDPFYDVFGQVTDTTENSITIRGIKGFENCTRHYEYCNPVSVDDFCQMMYRLREPGESLDMLACGQVIHNKAPLRGIKSKIDIQFEPRENRISTRLYIPHEVISDKAVLMHQYYNKAGTRKKKVELEFYMAKDFTWSTLVEPRKIATLTCKDYFAFKRMLKDLSLPPAKHPRFHQRLSENKEARDSLYALIQDSAPEETQEAIVARSAYEEAAPEKDHLFTPEHHLQYMHELHHEANELIKERHLLEAQEMRINWGWELTGPENRNARRRIHRGVERLEERLNEDGNVQKLNYFNPIFKCNKHYFHRYIDLIQAADSISNRNGDPRIGHIAMVSDLIPFVEQGWRHLTLKAYRHSIEEKLRARA
ncbi:MAG: hypothetical protein ACQESG_07520, partial [Nanobdellota archaeon]